MDGTGASQACPSPGRVVERNHRKVIQIAAGNQSGDHEEQTRRPDFGAMIVEVVAVGTELLLGQIVNSNAAEIGGRLAAAGLDHFHQEVVGDNLERAAGAVSQALERADALITTGGLGPTPDDVTREAICLAAGLEMEFSEEYAERLRTRWAARGRQMPQANLRQAELPAGATLIPNVRGTAPGIRLEVEGAWIFALPGVTAEMLPMLEGHVLPFLLSRMSRPGAVVHSRLLRTWGESESRVAEILVDLFEAQENPTLAFLASAGEIKIRLTARASDVTEAEALIEPVETEVRRRLGRLIFSAGGETIEEIVLAEIGERRWTLATAESATAGGIASRIASVPGASSVFRGGVVAYSPDLKRELLDVPAEVLDGYGLVSEETALAMAEGGASRLGADVVVAVTGSAGPKALEWDAGTVVVAVRTPENARARTLLLPGDRERVRAYGATAALHLVRLAVAGHWWT